MHAMGRNVLRGVVGSLFSVVLAAPGAAANRFFVEDQPLVIEKTTRVPKEEQWITIRCDNDFPLYGFSTAFKFDPAKLKVNSLELVDEAADAEWSNLVDTDPEMLQYHWFSDPANSPDALAYMNSTGEVIVGAILDYSPSGVPANDNTVPTGAGHRLLRLSVDVLAAAPGSTPIDFTDTLKNPGTQTTIKNVFTNNGGNTVPPVQADQTLSVVSWKPDIQSLAGNSGWAGNTFQVVGQNFGQAGLAVEVCGAAAPAVLRGDGITLDVTVPACAATGPAAVKVTTVYGEDLEAGGFTYVPVPVPSITSVTPSQGRPGTVFQVTGQNFDRPGLSVKVCGKALSAAEAVLRADGTTIDVTAPDCAVGAAVVEICNDVGCDSDGFTYLAPPEPVISGIDPPQGRQGTVFQVTGQNFDRSSLSVKVCGNTLSAAEAVLRADGTTIDVTAPDCAVGPAAVEVCTSTGCDAEPEGFTYLPPLGPVITSISPARGRAGTVFQVLGENFARQGRTVKVCEKNAVAILRADGVTLDVTAPDCGAGFAKVEVCTDAGCDSREGAAGFEYLASGKTFIRCDSNMDQAVDLSDAVATLSDLFMGDPAEAECRDAMDSNDDGSIDISDPVFVLNFLFLAGDAPPEPYPDPGVDTTFSETIPPCE